MDDNRTMADPGKFKAAGHKQLWILLGSQCLFGFSYWLLLSMSYSTPGVAGGETLIGFSIRGLLLIPIYWIIFVRYKNSSLQWRIVLHVFILIIYLWVSLLLYRFMCRCFGVKYLIGKYGNWDIYIPAMIYIIQFSFLHIREYFIKLKEQKEKEIKLRQLLLEAEVNLLKAQIQPHFFFNSLNSINASIPPEMEDTRALISQLSDIFRFALNASKQKLILISEEVLFIENYLNIEQRRHPTRLFVAYKIEPDTLEHYLPPMLLQPIIENSIKYAVDPSSLPVLISISIFKSGSSIVFEIADTGPGLLNRTMDELLSKGTGLFNIHQRLLTQFGQGLTVQEHTPKGLMISFSIPAHLAKP